MIEKLARKTVVLKGRQTDATLLYVDVDDGAFDEFVAASEAEGKDAAQRIARFIKFIAAKSVEAKATKLLKAKETK